MRAYYFVLQKQLYLYGYKYSVYITYIFKNRNGQRTKNMSGS